MHERSGGKPPRFFHDPSMDIAWHKKSLPRLAGEVTEGRRGGAKSQRNRRLAAFLRTMA